MKITRMQKKQHTQQEQRKDLIIKATDAETAIKVNELNGASQQLLVGCFHAKQDCRK